jgi:hypothetical protein
MTLFFNLPYQQQRRKCRGEREKLKEVASSIYFELKWNILWVGPEP